MQRFIFGQLRYLICSQFAFGNAPAELFERVSSTVRDGDDAHVVVWQVLQSQKYHRQNTLNYVAFSPKNIHAKAPVDHLG